MKTVVSPSEVAHLWANKVQDNARNSNNTIFFRDETIYSYGYHFPIAKHIINEQGDQAVLFTTRSYSNTTAKHIGKVHSACSHTRIIRVPRPDDTFSSNVEVMIKEGRLALRGIETARKPEKYISAALVWYERIKEYADFLGRDADLYTICNYNNDFTDFERIVTSESAKEEFVIAERERKAKIKAQVEQEHAEQLIEWLNFKTHTLYNRNGRDYLRYNATKDRLETSQGVELPSAIARELQTRLRNGELTVGEKILYYNVAHVDDKVLKVGCHTFPINYLLEFTW